MDTFLDLLEQFNNLDTKIQQINSLNGNQPFLTFGNKVVFEHNNEIYRIDWIYESYKRQLVREYALNEFNLDCFLEETPVFTNTQFRITKQPKIQVLENTHSDNEILSYLTQEQQNKMKLLQEKTGIFGFTHNNSGLLNNKLYIYDYIINCSCHYNDNQWYLTDKMVNTLYSIKGD